MRTSKKYLLIVVFIVCGLMVAANAETVNFENPPYPGLGGNIIGHDGWYNPPGSGTSTTAFTITNTPSSRPAAAGPVSQMGYIGESNNSFERIFNEAKGKSSGMYSYIFYSGNAGDSYSHWLILFDSTPLDADHSWALQLSYFCTPHGAGFDYQNAQGYFVLQNNQPTLPISPDIAEITNSTWYKVAIAYDLTDTGGDPSSHGKYSVVITNLSLPIPRVVWHHVGENIVGSIDEIDKFRLGNVSIGGDRMRIDDITFGPLPTTCQALKESGFAFLGDLNGDCTVNLADFASLASNWLRCNEPDDARCEDPLGARN